MEPFKTVQSTPHRPTASSLLAKFLPGISPKHKMDREEPHRVSTSISHAESETSPPRSSVETPQAQRTEDYDEMEEIQYSTQRRSGLRERKPNTSLKAAENGYSTPRRSRTQRRSAIEELIGGDLTPVVSDRIAIRQEIASKTAAFRDRFLLEMKDLFLPLLPPNNYVRKLVAKHAELSAEEIAQLPTITPYEEIDRQPRGLKATMKPYQLSGLSFMVYLHHNVSALLLPSNLSVWILTAISSRASREF